MSKTVFSIIQSLLKSWMTLRRLPMNSLLASNQNKFSQKWKCVVWRRGGELLLTAPFPFSDILFAIFQQNNVIVHFSASPAPWRRGSETSLGKLFKKEHFSRGCFRMESWKKSMNNSTIFPAASTVLASLWERAGDQKSQGSSKNLSRGQGKGRKDLSWEDLCPAPSHISASRHLTGWDFKTPASPTLACFLINLAKEPGSREPARPQACQSWSSPVAASQALCHFWKTRFHQEDLLR